MQLMHLENNEKMIRTTHIAKNSTKYLERITEKSGGYKISTWKIA